MQLVEEQDDVLFLADFVHDGLDALLELAAVFGTGHHESQIERDDLLVDQQIGHGAVVDVLRQPFGDGGFSHPGFAEQHRVVLGAAAKNLDDALDLVLSSDDGIELAVLGELGDVATKGVERGGFGFALAALLHPAHRRGFAFVVFPVFALGGGVVVGVEGLHDFVAGFVEIDAEVFEHAGGNPLPFAQQAEQDVFGPYVAMAESAGFAGGERQHLFCARSEGHVADGLGFGAGAYRLLNLDSHGGQVDSQGL